MLVLMLPPLRDYPEAPKDQSASVPTNCPECGQKAWISVKKKSIIKEAHDKVEYLVACYDCIEEFVKKQRPECHKINI